MVKDRWGDNWTRHIAAAVAYQRAHGHLRVPVSYVTPDGLNLGTWLNTHRVSRRGGTLAASRAAELDALGFVWDPLDEDWQRGLDAASRYAAIQGDLRVPTAFVTDDGFRLGAWINRRRVNRRQGQLSPEQIAQLEALGMVWEPLREDWERGLTAARAYRNTHGNLLVRQKFVTDDGFRLGAWINRLRTKRTNGGLATERIAELDALGMVWDARTNT